MALPALDDFNRGNGTPLGANWTVQENALKVTSNQAAGNSAVAQNSQYWSADATGDNQYAQVVVASVVDGGITVRAAGTTVGTQDFYSYYVKPGSASIYKILNNVQTDIVTGLAGATNGQLIRFEAEDTSLLAYRAGAQQGSTQTDSSLTFGQPGLTTFANSTLFDDFEGGNLATPAAVLTGTMISGGVTEAEIVSG